MDATGRFNSAYHEGVLTPDDVAQAYLETIGEATDPSSDNVISIGTLNVNMG